MKNKLSTIILILYVLVLIILSFNADFVKNVNVSIISLLKIDNPTTAYHTITYIETAIFYIGLGICVTLVCIEYFKTFKYILIYSVILSLSLVILDILIKSFYQEINFVNFIVALFSVLLGVAIQIFVKIKQIKGGKYEE